MVDGIENPYRSDLPVDALFVGREALLAELCAAVRSERNTVRAVMGGRGMGKSSLALQLRVRLATDALPVLVSGSAQQVAEEIGRALTIDLGARHPVETLVAAVKQHPKGRVVVVLDEVERLLGGPEGIGLLDNLRKAYELARGKLALFVLGGTAVRDLIEDQASPFLRIMGAGIHTLRGLERNEAAELIRLPLDLEIPDDVVDALWAESAGHPWLLQMVMEYAVEAAPSLNEVVAHIPAALQRAERRLQDAGFRPWWGNLRERGQEVYRRLAREASAVPSARWVACFGNDPRPWLDVLASTGLVFLDGEVVIVRGALFQRWVEQNHPAQPANTPDNDALGAWLTSVGADAFEHLVVRALASWARHTVEFSAGALKQDSHGGNGNNGLLPEAYFQIHALLALLQHEHDLTAEPEALSMRRAGRSDIKARSRHDPTRRACIELKIFGRNDHQVVKQVIEYSAPGDTFAAVISVDRCKRRLQPVYEAGCFVDAPYEAKHDAPVSVEQPALYTEHAREGRAPLRVWHFLVQLRGV